MPCVLPSKVLPWWLLQVIGLCEKERQPPLQYVFADTPGQIEIFTWSASGQIISEAFASTFPTAVLFVVDTPRCLQPQTFMSNMLQARLSFQPLPWFLGKLASMALPLHEQAVRCMQ